MEFHAKDIAKLVLGYLREEKCQAAFTEFINTSKHLQDYAHRFQRGKPIVTRIFGLNLVDYLTEYALVYTIVLERIELTDYYNTSLSKRPTLVQQLLYLLNDDSNDSRAHTPVHNDFSTQTFEESPTRGNNITADKATNTDDENSIVTPDKCNISEEIFTQTFLENTELHRKLADTINKTVSEFNSSPEIGTTVDLENAIKRIVNNTEQDPIFDQLIDEIMISSTNEDATSDCNNSASEFNVLSSLNYSTEPQASTSRMLNEQHIRHRLRSSNKKVIDDQNEAAISSIIAVSTLSTTAEEKNVHQEVCHNFETISNQNNEVLTNTSTGLLMLQPSTNNILTTCANTIQSDASKPFCVIGPQPYIGVSQLNTVFTEQDILTMPTIIVCDSNQVTNTPTVLNITPAPLTKNLTNSQVSSHTGLLKIVPKKEEKPKTLSEYIKRYNCEDPSPIKELKETKKSNKVPCKAKTLTKKGAGTPLEIKVETIPQDLATPRVKIDTKEGRSRTTPHSGGSHIRQLDFSTPDKLSSLKNAKGTCLFKNKTSDGTKVSKAKQTNNDTDLGNSTKTSAINNAVVNVEKPNKSQKEPSTSEKLFSGTMKKLKTSETTNVIIPAKRSSSWDADLRALTSASSEPQAQVSAIPKRKRSEISPNDISNASKKVKGNSTTLETTEDNAAKIEAMLVSPIKDIIPIKVADGVTTTIEAIENKFVILNRNNKSKYKKKCNTSSSDKANFTIVDQVVVTNIAKVASCEIIDEGKNKVILSPSKMNASKRNIIQLEAKDEQQKSSSGRQLSPGHQKNPVVNSSEMPLLETPVKMDIVRLPKTPGLFGTPVLGTPFTKAVIDQLGEVDLNAIHTPKFPITPNFGLTPFIGKDQSPAGKPGTDYSTSSSYYQPSDAEQSKSLEQLIEECKRLEDGSQQISDKLVAFNQSLVGRKNLNLLQHVASKEVSDKSSESSSDSDSDSSGSDSSDENNQKILQEELSTVQKRYSFRPRRSTQTSDLEPLGKGIKTHREQLLQEMAEKRQRTIARIKNESGKSQSKEVPKQKKAQPRRRSSTGPPKKTPATKKQTHIFTQGSATINNDKEVALHLVSDEEMQVEPFEVVETTLMEKSSSSTPIPEKHVEEKSSPKGKENEDQAADSLVKGLKEWGIHLIPKKRDTKVSPTKTAEDIEQPDVTNVVEPDVATALSIEIPTTKPPENPIELIVDKPTSNDITATKPSESPVNSVANQPTLEVPLEKHINIIAQHCLKSGSMSLVQTPQNKERRADVEEVSSTPIETAEPISKQNETEALAHPNSIETQLRLMHLSENNFPLNTETKKEQVPKPQPESSKINKSSKHISSISNQPLELEEGEILSEEESRKRPKRKSTSISRSRNRSNEGKRSHHSRDRHTKKTSKTVTKQAEQKQELIEMFSVKVLDKENMCLKHDYNKKCTRTLADYNLEILNKTISASIYITEQDSEVTKLLSFTPTEIILDIPEKHVPNDDRDKVSALSTLYNELVKPSSTSTKQKSVLDNLYPEERLKYKRNSNDIQHKIAERKYAEKLKESKSAKRHSESSSKESRRHRSPKTTVKRDKDLGLADKEGGEVSSQDVGALIVNDLPDPSVTIVDAKATVDHENSPVSINDDLMNYAVVGSTRIANPDEFELSVDSIRQTKSKLNNEDGIKDDNKSIQSEDTAACQALLRNIDVDIFLKQLHGDK